MLKELATKRLGSPPRNRYNGSMVSNRSSLKRKVHTKGGSSNGVIAALDALEANAEEDDSDIEILGPFPLPPLKKKAEGLLGKMRAISPGNGECGESASLQSFFGTSVHHVRGNMSEYLSRSPATTPTSMEGRAKSVGVSSIVKPTGVARAACASISNTVGVHQRSNKLIVEDPISKETSADPLEQSFPVYSYKDYKPTSTIVYTRHEDEANDLIGGLCPGPVAMDCEWRVFFRKSRGVGSSASRERRVAVVQVADTRGMILVIQVYAMGRFPIRLIDLLENSKVAKFGVNILNDGNKLFRDYGILSNNLVELGALALVADPSGTERSKTKRKIVSLAKLVQWYCSKTLEKGDERTSNWEMELSKQQLHYAANDVHSSLVVYKNMCDLARIHEIDLDKQSNLFTSSVSWPAPAPTPAPTPTHADSQPSDTPTSQVPAKKYMHPQHLRAYNFWHIQHMSMHDMCLKLSLKAQYPHLQTHIQTQTQTQDIRLKPSTVISYIVGALQADPALEWNVDELRKLLQMEAGSWVRHRDWVLSRGLQIPSSV